MSGLNRNDTVRVGREGDVVVVVASEVKRYGCAGSFGLGNERGLDSQCEKGRWVSM